jgi:hypothetical protein|nr:MAG TPA: hypothetical protein [Caudoviricetes sp.]
MTTTNKIWVLKRIDELGNCYHTVEVDNYILRNRFIREWIGDDRNYTKTNEDDVSIILKRNGEELWYYEIRGEDY